MFNKFFQKKSSKNECSRSTSCIQTRKPRVLCLHGWRTSAKIMQMQMAAFCFHVKMDYHFVDAPFSAQGAPDPGIALFYPDQQYYEWYHKDDSAEEKKAQVVDYIFRILDEEGPFDGILGFSQGAGMATRVVHSLQTQARFGGLKFVVLIGGVPPVELVREGGGDGDWGPQNVAATQAPPLQFQVDLPSLHVVGKMDPYLALSRELELLYARTKSVTETATDSRTVAPGTVEPTPAEEFAILFRASVTHAEGHNIPSLRTGLYPSMQAWMLVQAERS